MKSIRSVSTSLWSILVCALFYNGVQAQVKMDEALNKTVDQEIQNLMEEGDIPGLSVILVNRGETLIKSFGYQNLQTKQLVTPQTLFQLGSCSKAFTALAVYRLLEVGTIDLDADITTYIPWLASTFENKKATITVRQLLHHTSGIPWNTISKIPETDAADALEHTVRTLIDIELSNAPGTKFEYATINYDVLALIIQYQTGQHFESWLQENILTILELKSTSIGEPIDDSKMAVGYKIGFFDEHPYDAPIFRGNNAAGYVISNANDMAQWLLFQMNLLENPLKPLVTLTHLRDETVPLHGQSSYASGWEIALDGSGEISHAGVNPNFTTYTVFRPKQKIGVMVLANSNSTYTPLIAQTLLKRLAGETIKQQPDPGDNNDKIYSVISFAVSAYILFVAGLFVRIIVSAARGKRKYESFTLQKTWIFIRAMGAIIPFLAGLYILPKALAGFTWNSIMVWTPASFPVMAGLIVLAIIISYSTYFLSMLFPDPDKYKRMAPQIILLSVLSGLSNVIIIVLVTSSLGINGNLVYLLFYYGLAIGLYLLGRRFVQINLIRITRGLVYDLRMQLINKVFSTSYQKFEKIERGRIYTTINDDINTVGESTNTFMLLITSIITATGAFLYLASIAFWATVLTILLIVALASLYYMVSLKANKYFIEARDERNTFISLINGMIDGFKELSLHRKKKLEFRKDVATSAGSFKEKLTTADTKFVNAFLVGESLLVILLGMVAFGMPELFKTIQISTVMSFVIILLYLIGPINGILSSVPGLMQLSVAWNRIQVFLKEIPANLNLDEIPVSKTTEIESLSVRNVSFRYKNTDEKSNFEIGPMHLDIKKGEIIFLIGGNGSGKTTLAKLLTGLYEPDEGKILVNGRQVTSAELSEYYSTVFSPSYLFKKLYNIDVHSKSEEISRYLSVLDLTNKVEISDKGYSTTDLSGGQRKRLALLQCYLEDSPIYLFDEWAADQDPEYRNFFYRTLLPEMKAANKMVIAITHDDHYFDVADRVFKMEEGQLKVHKHQKPVFA